MDRQGSLLAIRTSLPLAALLLAACGSDPVETPTGTVQLRFSVSNTVRSSRNLKDGLLGDIYGSLFIAEEVTVTGPIEGAQDLNTSIALTGVDLRTADTSTASWTSDPLPVGSYIFLGFYDVDENGADTRDPDSGDPVTLPINPFEIKDGEKTPHVVTFDLVFN